MFSSHRQLVVWGGGSGEAGAYHSTEAHRVAEGPALAKALDATWPGQAGSVFSLIAIGKLRPIASLFGLEAGLLSGC